MPGMHSPASLRWRQWLSIDVVTYYVMGGGVTGGRCTNVASVALGAEAQLTTYAQWTELAE